jgi:phosphatidylglycerophosphate synthase
MFEEIRKTPNLITGFRFILVPVLWVFALSGRSEWVGYGVILGGISDAVDGLVARRLNLVSEFGSKFDSIADQLLQLSTIVWILMLHPEVFTENSTLSIIALVIYLLSLAVGLVKFRRIANLHLYLSKLVGPLLFVFVVHTLISGRYSPALFMVACIGFILSSTETLALQLISTSVDEDMGSLLFVLLSRVSSTKRYSGKG